jgi:glucose dehydrogenase
MPGTSTLLIAAVERSKLPFFVAGGVLVVWALGSAALGMRRSGFPGKGAGLVAYLTATVALVLTTMGLAVATAGTDPAPPWESANGDLRNHRVATGSEITSSNVRDLGVAWTMPLTASSIYGTFAANPVTDAHGVVYLQDLQSNVFAVDAHSGRRVWSRTYNSQDIGPNGVVVSDGVVYGATAAFAFALDAKTGRELWRNTRLVPPARQKGGGELASGFGIDIQP